MSLVSGMAFQNQWWADRNRIYEDEHVRRALSSNPRFLPRPPEGSALILGPRQVGKTTSLKLAILNLLESGADPREVLYFSCDALSDKEDLIELVSQYRTYVNPGKAYFFLDEVTFVEDWNVGLIHLFNAGYFKGSVVFVTGSASVSLKKVGQC